MKWPVVRTKGCFRKHRLKLYLILVLLFVTTGCKNQWKSSSTLDSTAHAAADVAVASGESPTDVAKAALQAIQAKDKAALQKLIAVKKVKMDVEAITRGRSAFQGMLDKAIPIAIGAISSEINWLDADDRAIDQESITGNTAVVTVKGKRAGQAQTRRFFLVQEDGQWRLVPSHRKL